VINGPLQETPIAFAPACDTSSNISMTGFCRDCLADGAPDALRCRQRGSPRIVQARRLCPEAVVIPLNMSKYVTVGRDVRRLMLELTPRVEPLSIGEAFLDLAGTTRLHLKLKTADFKSRARALARADPARSRIFEAGRRLLTRETDGTYFRLIGIAVSQLVEGGNADPPDLIDDKASRAAAAEQALDQLRHKFGRGLVIRGLAFNPDRDG
jgi:hypothetical protein